jgi:D-arabinose 1-dehydrogenase-like Zn-dependent alcohol dehydrogenase
MAITQDAPAPDAKFVGWAAVDDTAIEGNLQLISYQPKTFCEDDIEVKILYSGICGSDLHTISGGWGDMSEKWPQVVGHEIVGEVVRVGGDSGKRFKLGDMVGIGAQCDSCQECEWCDGRESLRHSAWVALGGSR